MKSSASNDFAQFSQGRSQHVFQYCEYHLLKMRIVNSLLTKLCGIEIISQKVTLNLYIELNRKHGKITGDQYEGKELFLLSFCEWCIILKAR